ncbi:hypothetical protein ACLOJK_001733 [Asimina triloba]
MFRAKPLLSSCTDPKSVAQIHALMLLSGILNHVDSSGHLISSYARTGDISSARKVFDEMPQKSTPSCNAMIIAYSRRNSPIDVLSIYHRMIVKGPRPDSSTFTLSLKACAALLDLEAGEEIRSQAIEFGYKDDVFVASSVLSLYVKCGKIDEAMGAFDVMPRRDLVSWTTMITGFAQSGRMAEALGVYQRMRSEGIEGDGVMMVGLLQACTGLGHLKMGLSVHGYIIRQQLPIDVVVETSIVDMYAKNGLLELAYQVFKRMSLKNVVTWSALISGFAQNGFATEALKLLVEMQDCRLEPDLVALVSALLACSQIGYLKLGKSIHGFIVRRQEFDKISGTAIIDMYAKCGSLSTARALFDRVKSRDLISWNAMISSYGVHGCGKEALLLFTEMKSLVKPDDATFASLLSAFSHSGMVEEGQFWFDFMIREFGIQPSKKHYACMVDLLARAGKIEEAWKLIKSISIEPGIAAWVAILSGCRNHANLRVGEMVANKVLELNPNDPGIYALVSNVFSAARKWDEVAHVRKIMKKMGMKKVPGYSIVEVNRKQHAFLMEDKSHPEHEKIMAMLEKLDFEMRKMGYVPNTEFVLHLPNNTVEEDNVA